MARFPTTLGNVGSPRTQQQTFAPSQPAEAFGAGVGVALQGLGGDLGQLGQALGQQEQQKKRFEAERKFMAWQGAAVRDQMQAAQEAPPGMDGFTNARYGALTESERAFLSDIDPSLQEEFRSRSEGFKQRLTTEAFSTEMEAQATYQAAALEQTLDGFREATLVNPGSAQQNAEDWAALVQESTLSPTAKEELIRSGQTALLEAEYLGHYQLYAEADALPDDMALAAAIGAPATAVLNAIAAPESGGRYDVRYDGSATGATFTDFSDHPRIFVTRPDGRKSSAAGKYQITATTWDWIAGKLGLTDFSPASQDKAAWWLAQHLYRKSTGEELEDAILTGDRRKIKEIRQTLTAANGGWEAFDGMSDDAFANSLLGSGGIRGEVASARTAPDIWTDPHYDEIEYDRKFALSRHAQSMVDAAQAEREALARQSYDSNLNALLIDVRNGARGEIDILEAEATWLNDFDDQQKVRNVWEQRNKEQSDLQTALVRLQSPTAIWSYADSEDRGLMDALMVGLKYEENLAQMNDEWVDDVLLPITERTATLSPKTMNKLKGMAASRNFEEVSFAYNTMAKLEDSANPAWVDFASEDQIRKLNWWRNVAPFYMEQPDELLMRLNRNYDSRTQQLYDQNREEASRIIREEFDDSTITDQFGGWFSSPELPADTLLSARFRTRFQGIFREEYAALGDKDAALEAATKVMMKRWGASSVGGRYRVGDLVPESIYPSIGQKGGTKDWIEPQARQELGALDSRFLRDDFEFLLITDSKTETEYTTYQSMREKGGTAALPSYLVFYMDEDGTMKPLQDENGTYVRWRGEVTSQMKEEIELEATRGNTEIKQRRVRNRMLELQENLPFMSDKEREAAEEELKVLRDRDRGLGETLETYQLERAAPGAGGEVVIP